MSIPTSFDDGVELPDGSAYHSVIKPLRRPSPSGTSGGDQSVKVLYIAGLGRSGSTLLDRLLGSASRIHSGGEIGGLWQQGLVDDRLCSCGVRFSCCPFWQAVGSRSFSSLRAQQIDTILRYTRSVFPARQMWRVIFGRTRRSLLMSAPAEFWDMTGSLYTAIRDVSRGQVVVDSSKLTTYLVMLAHLSSIDVHVVHLVRDPRAVAHSWLRPRVADPDGRTSMPRFGPVKSALLWMIMNGTVELFASRVGLPYVRVRYEDLVADPARIVGQLRSGVLGDAGLELEQDGRLEGEDINLNAFHSISGNPMRFLQGRMPIVEDAAWKRDSRSRRAIVEVITFPLRWRYGYRGHQ
jgi:Sulfotransferase family